MANYEEFIKTQKMMSAEATRLLGEIFPDITDIISITFSETGAEVIYSEEKVPGQIVANISQEFLPKIYFFNPSWKKWHELHNKKIKAAADEALKKHRNDVIRLAYEIAIDAHKDQTYDDKPYLYHLQKAKEAVRRFSENLTEFEIFQLEVAAILHDVLEDTLYSFAKIKQSFPASWRLIWAVTDGEGENRKERKAESYKKIAETPLADHLKLCDRIVNVENCLLTKNVKKFNMYVSEQPAFEAAIYKKDSAESKWTYLRNLLRERI